MDYRWLKHFRDGSSEERDLLGGKGANLAEMTRLGLPVPPGFTVTTEACRHYLDTDSQVPPGLWEEVDAALREIELSRGSRFGDPANPLLLSVRSGAKFSMPGMMDTVLDLGLNDETLPGLIRMTNERFALDAYRRLIQMYGKVVLGVDGDRFEQAIETIKRDTNRAYDVDLTPDDLRRAIFCFREIIAQAGATFPTEPMDQLRGSILAVFRSWNGERARAYRRANNISETLGTAVNIQSMVFGNLGPDSASGVAFTRNPSTGERALFGEYLPEAQGEDVVAGIRTPLPVEQMACDPAFAAAYRELTAFGEKLERHFADMQDLEFTVERGRLWMLQTRTGKRTATAAVKIAVDMALAGSIDQTTAIRRVLPEQIEQLLHPRIDDSLDVDVLATGLPASPGAATGTVVFDREAACERAEAGEAVILVRNETSADDFPGMLCARGVLTARGGMTSHAAVVARGMGKPAVTGCSDLEIDETAGYFTVHGLTVHTGDALTIDGSTGRVMLGTVPTIAPGLTADLETLLTWADRHRRLGVRANADTPEDAHHARDLGAEGIGLCRTEHMFFGDGRIDAIREMILAEDDQQRAAALARLEPLQVADFTQLFETMHGYPVTIRLLDPPLHEFLPHDEHEIERIAADLSQPVEHVKTVIASHWEANPMLGLRGCRMGLIYPEITVMQTRAIMRAAIDCAGRGIRIEPELMVPLVATTEELRRQRELIEETAATVMADAGVHIDYRIGTMIEVPRAAILAGKIAEYADFFSYGTNDLTQTTFGLSRDDSARFLPTYVEQGVLDADPFQILDQEGVGELIVCAKERGRATKPNLTTGICGEHGGEPSAIAFCHQIGLDYVSCSPYRVPIARLAAAHAALGEITRDK